HGTMSKRDPNSPTYALNVTKLCSQCHRRGRKAALRLDPKWEGIVASYEESIHGKGLLESGLTVSASCVDCHTAHRELPLTDRRSSINPANVAETCAQCHRGIYRLFRRSIHDPQVRPNTVDGIANAYSGKLCALVDIDEQMLPFCAPRDIEMQIKEIIEKAGSPEGGLMIYAIPSEDVPLENIEAMCTGWEKHCFYGWP
ncbi:hypothetical protein LCGC14_2002340, partial [marine sediment metagenome]